MFRFSCSLIAVLVVGQVHLSCGYKWIALKENDSIPVKAVRIGDKFIGRARHFQNMLPAEVHNTSYAVVDTCGKRWVKTEFQVLEAFEECEWHPFMSYTDLPENTVLAGKLEDNEPVYVGRTSNIQNSSQGSEGLMSLYFRDSYPLEWSKPEALICKDPHVWVDTSAFQLPENPISATNWTTGHFTKANRTYVARLLKDCDIIPGQVQPEMGIASAVTSSGLVESQYCQVLIGLQLCYWWVDASNGEIPDYAVVGAKRRDGSGFMYVAMYNNTVGYVEHKTASKMKFTYKVLIKRL